MRGRRVLLLLIPLLASSGSVAVAVVLAANLQDKTLAAWERYRELTEARIESELASKDGFLVRDFLDAKEQGEIRKALASGIYVQRMRTRSEEGGDIDVPDGIVHHWYGTVIVPDAKLDQVLSWVQNYPEHQSYYDEVEESRLESKSESGESYDIFLRLKRTKVITVHYATEHRVDYRRHGEGKASSRSESTRIAEIEDPGTDREREKPIGDDRGFLWRLNSYWRFQQTGAGVVVECESMSLSRSIPLAFAWVVKPFINSVPRESLLATLLPIRNAFVD